MRRDMRRIWTVLLVIGLGTSVGAAPAEKGKAPAGRDGTYRSGDNELNLQALDGNKVKFRLDLQGPAPAHNSGALLGEATIDKDSAVYKTTENGGPCVITLKFLGATKVQVSQQGEDADCGFGHSVRADGSYTKVKGSKPKFTGQ
jgi:hypothetical protein